MGFTIEKRPALTQARTRDIAKRVIGREVKPIRQKIVRDLKKQSSKGRFLINTEVVVDRFGIAVIAYLVNDDQPADQDRALNFVRNFTVGELFFGLNRGFPAVTVAPRNAQVLHWVKNGEDVFSMGHDIPARPGKHFIEALVKEITPEFIDKAREGWKTTLVVIMR